MTVCHRRHLLGGAAGDDPAAGVAGLGTELDDLIGGLSVTVQNGVLGKWKYAEELDAFIALEDAVEGNVWAYKPFGWQAAAVPLPGAYALFAGGLLLVAATARRRA